MKSLKKVSNEEHKKVSNEEPKKSSNEEPKKKLNEEGKKRSNKELRKKSIEELRKKSIEEPKKTGALFDVDAEELKKNLLEYYKKYDPEEIQNIDDVVDLAREIGEQELDIKLHQYYGESLSAYLKTKKGGKKAEKRSPPQTPPRALPPGQANGEIENEDEVTKLKDEIKVFYQKHDPARLNNIEEIIKLAKRIGRKALNSYLLDFYGETLDEAIKEKIEMEKRAKEVEKVAKKREAGSKMKATSENSTEKKQPNNLREEIVMFYNKHDPLKLEAVDTIVDLASKIGRDNLNDKLALIYGESLDEMLKKKQNAQLESSAIIEGRKNEDIQAVASPKQSRRKEESGPNQAGEKVRSPRQRNDRDGRDAAPGVRTSQERKAEAQKKISARMKLMSFKGNTAPVVPMKMLIEEKSHRKEAKKLLGKPSNSPLEGGPCDNYRLDMTGASFGVCVCGYSRIEHNKQMNKPAWGK